MILKHYLVIAKEMPGSDKVVINNFLYLAMAYLNWFDLNYNNTILENGFRKYL